MRLRLAMLLLPLLTGLGAMRLAAQAPDAASGGVSAAAPTPIRTSTHLVQINIVVRAKNGAPMPGLKQEDFTVFDQGKPQKIAIFASETGSPRSAGVPAPAAPANTFSNRLEQGGQAPGSVTVVLMDALNTTLQDQSYARAQILKFLRTLQPQDHIALYLLTTHLTVLHEFTSDSQSLMQALSRLKGSSSGQLDSDLASTSVAGNDVSTSSDDAAGPIAPPQASTSDAPTDPLQNLLDWGNGQLSDFATANRAETTAEALEAIADHVSGVPGRKSLIWVSGSFPISINLGLTSDTLAPADRDARSFAGEIERAAQALNRVDMAIYPVDTRGLLGLSMPKVGNNGAINMRRPGALAMTVPAQGEFDTMNMLADRTGGHAFTNTNDISGAARQAMSDGELTYLIGFYPDHGKWDGKYHELKVRLNVPDTTARYRKGYFAAPDPPNSDLGMSAALRAAVASPIDFTALSLRLEVTRPPVLWPGSRILHLRVSVDTRDLSLAEQDGRWKGELDLMVVQLGVGDTMVSVDQKRIALNLDPKTHEALLQQGINLSKDLPLSPDTVSLRVVARDAASGAIGSLSIPKASLPPSPPSAPSAR